MLKLHVLDQHGNPDTIYYNPYSFNFYHDNKCDKPLIGCFDKLDIDLPRGPKVVIIPLGYNCKNKCVYCMQNKMTNPPLNMKKVLNILESYIEQGVSRIHFLGGEPLLQWSVIKTIMDTFPFVQYSIITNGLYLTLDIAEILAEKHCKLTISHDGESQLLQRGVDILSGNTGQKQILDWLSREVPVDVTSVICSEGTTMLERYNYLLHSGIDFHAINIKPLIPYKRKHLTIVTGIKDWNRYFSNLLTDIYVLAEQTPWKNGNTSLLKEMQRFCVLDHIEWHSDSSHCTIFNKEFVTINQSGYIQYCHNCELPVTLEQTKQYLHRRRLERCHDCPVLLTCSGMCRIIDDEDVWNIACTRTFYFHLAYFIYFIHQTYGYMITSIDGDYLHSNNGTYHIAHSPYTILQYKTYTDSI